MQLLEPKLKQRGRAEVDFMAYLFYASASFRQELEVDIASAAGNIDELPEDLDQRNEHMEAALAKSKAHRVSELLREWLSINSGMAAVSAFAEIQGDIQAGLDRYSSGSSMIEVSHGFSPPSYWDGVEFHRTAGGWDGHEYMGYIHGEIIHKRMVEAFNPGGIAKQRLAVARSAPKQRYQNILDMGCSTGHFTKALSEVYPDANITGIDLSLKTLEHAQRVANHSGLTWRLIQGRAESTGLSDSSFDLVCSYILLHEVPAKIVEQLFSEAFRLLQPGGDLLMSDVTRYADMDKLGVWKADRGATYGGEPHWRASASLDLKHVAESVGFTNVRAGGLDGSLYPYVVIAKKPD